MLKHFVLITLFGYAFSIRDSSECGVTKECLFFPEGCSLSDSSCTLFTYHYNITLNNFEMELSGGTGNGNYYSAVAFSNFNKMENMDIYFCTGNKLLTGKVEQQYSNPVIDGSIPPEVTAITAETKDGIAQCSFTRASLIKRVLQGDSVDFDLSKSSFYIIWAQGPFSETPKYHSGGRGVSTSKVTLSIEALATECGKSVGCFRQPLNCIPGSDCMFFSWIYDESNNEFEFTIIGKQRSTESYQAFAFATTEMMQDADVYYCTKDKLGVSQITNLGDQPIDVSTPGISKVSSSEQNGNLICSFTRPAAQTRQISNGESKIFDLKNEKFYLLYCIAPVSSSGGMTQHRSHDDRGASSQAIDFTTFTGGSGGSTGTSTVVKLVRAHAVLMMLAWMLFSNIGIVVARHFKPLWPDNKINGKAAWFQIHRFVMVTTAICTIIAIICIFSAIKGYSSNAGAHPVIGLLVTVLTILNPIMAGFRPAPNSEKRWMFNVGHFIVGYSARILSIAAIFLGVKLRWFQEGSTSTWIMVGFVVNQVIVEVVLEAISAINGHIKTKYSKTTEISREGFNIKYLLLAYSILANVGFVAAITYYTVL